MENLTGKVVKLKDGDKGFVVCQLQSGEYLLGQDKGCQIGRGFFEDEVVEIKEMEPRCRKK